MTVQIELDEEIEIGAVPMFSAGGDDHEMYVALIRYKDRRYISLSRMNRHKLKRTGEVKITHRNSIWIPISDGKKIAELIWRAATEAARLHWEDIYDEDQTARYVAALEEGEKVFRYSVNVCRDARIFLSTAKDSLEDDLGLKVKVASVAEKLSFTLPQIVRAVDYLEDADYIKHVKLFRDEDISEFVGLMPGAVNILLTPNFKERIHERAQQLSKMTDEQVNELNYLDDEDPRLKYWECFMRFAEAEILKTIVTDKVPASFEITAKGYDWLDD